MVVELQHATGCLVKFPSCRPCLGPRVGAARRLYAISRWEVASAFMGCVVYFSAFCVAGGRRTCVCRAPFGGFIRRISFISLANAVPNTTIALSLISSSTSEVKAGRAK
jgi:hypothetical protein